MPERFAQARGSVPARLARRLLATWPVWPVIVAIGVIVVCVGYVGFVVGFRLVPPDAVRATASSISDGHVLVTHEITDPRIVNDIYTRINRFSYVPADAVFHCAPPGPMTYSFTFTRWGIDVEEAAPVMGCGGLWGVGPSFMGGGRLGTYGDTNIILTEAQLPLSS